MASDTGTSKRLPNCASLPLTVTVACPTSTEVWGVAPGSMWADSFMEAEEPPRSAPLPTICMARAAASMPRTSISPPNCIDAGPTLVLTVPL